MARAKRTDRAEARRRYRAALLEQGQGDPETGDIEIERAATSTGRSPGTNAGATTKTPARPSMFAALKGATRPVHYVDDLRYTPTLILRTNAIWPAVLISVGALAYGLTQNDYTSGGLQFVTGLLIASPPLIQPMLAGFLTPRATWLAGIISSLVASVCLEVLIIWAYSGHISNMPAGTVSVIPLTVELSLTAVTFGALLGAASGWYKRFLNLAGMSGARSSQRPAAKKPPARRSSARR